MTDRQRMTPGPRKQLEPIDPDSAHGREVARALGELFDDVIDRLTREGKPVPSELLGEPAPEGKSVPEELL